MVEVDEVDYNLKIIKDEKELTKEEYRQVAKEIEGRMSKGDFTVSIDTRDLVLTLVSDTELEDREFEIYKEEIEACLEGYEIMLDKLSEERFSIDD
ncbi:hypothetical protein H6504_01255 [Candidatus Woesearchaeota archaeon]|nr:hypothetical protein [Candidatus Woesearchaeota archaeon]